MFTVKKKNIKMPDLKVRQYSIKINGIDENIDAVKSLNAQLAQTKELLDSINAAKANGGGTSKVDTSGYQELEKLQTKITQLQGDQALKVQELKEIQKGLNEQNKTLLAQQRQEAGAYANTMAGMKQELADVKRVMNQTDLGSEEFGKLTARADELTTKLKDIEASYGTFSRNVGNYSSAFEGFTKINVQVGNTTREFNNVREASRTLGNELKAMVLNGQQDTEEFKQLEEATHNFQMKLKEAESALNDLKASSKGMDDMLDMFESLTATMSISKGFSTFFGIDNSEFEESMKKLMALQNMLQGIEKLRLQMETKEGIGKLLSKGNASIDKFTKSLFGLNKEEKALQTNAKGAAAAEATQTTATGALTVSTRAATVAATALNVALKAIGLGLIIGAVSLLADGITSVVKGIGNWIKGDSELYDNQGELNNRIQTTNKLLDQRIAKIKEEKGNDGYADILDAQNKALQTQINLVKQLIEENEDLNETQKKAYSNGISNGNRRGFGIENIEDLNKAWEQTNRALETGIRRFQLLDRQVSFTESSLKNFNIQLRNQALGEWLNELEKAVKLGGEAGVQLQDNLLKELNTKPILISGLEAAPDAIQNLVNSVQNGVQRAKIDLKVDAILDEANMDKIDAQLSEGIKKIEKERDAARKELQAKYIKEGRYIDSPTGAVPRSPKDKEAFDKEWDVIKKQYNEALKKYYQDLDKNAKEYEQQLGKLRIDMMRDSLSKTLKQLNLNKDAELNAAKQKYVEQQKNLERYNKVVEAIEANYRKRAIEEEKKYYRDQAKLQQDATQRLLELQIEAQKSGYERINAIEQNGDKTDMFNAMYEQNYMEKFRTINKQNEKYFGEWRKTIRFQNDKLRDEEKELEGRRYESQKQEHMRELDELKEALNKQEITQKEFNAKEEVIQKQLEVLKQEHFNKLGEINKKYANQEKEFYNDIYGWNMNNAKNAYEYLVKEHDKYLDDLERENTKYGGFFSFMNRGALKQEFEQYKGDLVEVQASLVQWKDNVRKEMNLGNISFEEGTNIVEQIDAMLADVDTELDSANKNMQDKRKDWLQETHDAVSQLVTDIAPIVSNMFQAMWNAEDAMWEEQKDRMEAQISEFENALKKQEDITKKHNTRMNDINGELTTARGARRDALVEALNDEIEAQRASLQKEKALAEQKERLDKQLKDKEKENDKKEQERAIINALIQGASATINALATVPFVPAGLAASALAAGLVASQIAVIKAQKYEDGGVIQGASHSAGGVKVLGGRAEVEGGEYIVNKATTAKNEPLLSYINSQRGTVTASDMLKFYTSRQNSIRSNVLSTKFANGGKLPDVSTVVGDGLLDAIETLANRPVQVAVTDINKVNQGLTNVKVLAGLN